MHRHARVACLGGMGFLLAALFVGAGARGRSLGHETPATVPVPAAAEDPQESFKTEVRSLLEQQNFMRLDEMGDELNRTKARFPGGDWKSYRFIEALAGPVEGEKAPDEVWEHRLAVLRRWRAERPQSMTAAIALVDGSVNFGWKARGKGFADTVTPEGWRLLAQRMGPAEDILLDVARRTPKTLDWYRAMIDLGRIQGWDRARVDALFEDAVALDPHYLHVYSAMARYLMPRWQGEEGDWERFADKSAERLGGQEGSIVYGHIAWQISKFYRGHDFFDQNAVSWPRVKQGFIDRETVYGTSVRNLNAFCLLAGSAADRETTRKLLTRIGDQWDPAVWQEWKYFEGYRKWAFPPRESPVRTEPNARRISAAS